MKVYECQIPDKLYFRIGEVSDIVGVKPYVLRYWESEFTDINPTKSKSGQRLYKRKDVEMLIAIKQLLYEERFTINGARKRLKELSRGEALGDISSAVQEDPADYAEMPVNVPKQLEVFATQAPASASVNTSVNAAVRTVSPDNKKIFQKIKKDLESLLSELKD